MMTPEELAEELKNLHYTEKLVLAQKLIEYAYDELGQLSNQLAPKRSSCTMDCTESKANVEPELDNAPEKQQPQDEQPAGKTVKKTQRKSRKTEKIESKEAPSPADEILSFNDLVSRLQSLKCKNESSLINAIINLYQYRGEISREDAKKIISRLKQKKIISIDDNNRILWN